MHHPFPLPLLPLFRTTIRIKHRVTRDNAPANGLSDSTALSRLKLNCIEPDYAM